MTIYFYNYSWDHLLLFLAGPISIILFFYTIFEKKQVKKFILFAISGIFFIIFLFTSSKSEESLNWYSQKLKFEESLVLIPQIISKEKKPAILVISAEWCDSCNDLKKRLKQKEIANLINKGWTLFEIDLTDYEKKEEKVLKEWEVYGVPALVFYDLNGNVIKQFTLVGAESPKGTLISILRQFGNFEEYQ